MSKFIIAFVFLINITACHDFLGDKTTEYPFYVGTYTNGDSEGIYKYSLHIDGTLSKIGLVAKTENPSFLTISKDRKYLLACKTNSDVEGSKIKSFLINDDSLSYITNSTTGGAHPCYITINKYNYIITANYTTGNVSLHKLDNLGKVSDLLFSQDHFGKGVTDRQKSPHAHSTFFDADELDVISVDLGTNDLWFSRLDTIKNKLIESKPYKLAMSPGAGPRHLIFHPNKKWIYVINELNCTVTQLKKNTKEKYEIVASWTTLPSGYIKPNTCADIHISADGKYLYASNRGHNSIAIYKVNADTGTLILIGHENTKGVKPRNFSLSPHDSHLLVANQTTNNIVSFKRDKNTGLLEYIDQIEAPTPVCILF
ncbi:MAG: lactonase family protein [Saprospiraceae bacterium]